MVTFSKKIKGECIAEHIEYLNCEDAQQGNIPPLLFWICKDNRISLVQIPVEYSFAQKQKKIETLSSFSEPI